MIVRDESLTLGRILQQASEVCDEMIVVDTGSTDNTKQIALDHGAKVWDFEWIDDFAAARNFSLSKCRGDWVMWLDADDVLPLRSRLAINNLKVNVLAKPEFSAVACPYHYTFDPSGRPANILKTARFFRRSADYRWTGCIHETLTVNEMACVENIIVEHRPHPDNLARKGGRNVGIVDKHNIDVESAPLRDLFAYATVLAQKRPTEAVALFNACLKRLPEGNPGGMEYSVHLNLADTYRQMEDTDKALDAAYKCLQIDPARAEAFSLLGIIYLIYLKRPSVAWPFFVAATQCPLPPAGTITVNRDYYCTVPLRFMQECLAAMNSRQPADRLTEIAGLIQARLQPVPIPAQAAQSHR
jgi:hypothetical protein